MMSHVSRLPAALAMAAAFSLAVAGPSMAGSATGSLGVRGEVLSHCLVSADLRNSGIYRPHSSVPDGQALLEVVISCTLGSSSADMERGRWLLEVALDGSSTAAPGTLALDQCVGTGTPGVCVGSAGDPITVVVNY